MNPNLRNIYLKHIFGSCYLFNATKEIMVYKISFLIYKIAKCGQEKRNHKEKNSYK